MKIICLIVAAVLCYYDGVEGHGALYDPPSRNSAWRFGFNTPTDYQDMGYNCGSYESTYVAGKPYCGVCGNTNSECPSQTYCKNVIVKTYKAGATIPVTINFNANHGGVIQFRLCPSADGSATWSCLESHRLNIQEASGKSIWQEPGGDGQNNGDKVLHVQLPSGLTCARCVFQWHWSGANYYGTCSNGTSGMGCGPQQTYIACADIKIE